MFWKASWCNQRARRCNRRFLPSLVSPCNQSTRILRGYLAMPKRTRSWLCKRPLIESWSTLVSSLAIAALPKPWLKRSGWLPSESTPPSNGLMSRPASRRRSEKVLDFCACHVDLVCLIEACVIRYFAKVPTFTVEQGIRVDFAHSFKCFRPLPFAGGPLSQTETIHFIIVSPHLK